MKIVFLEYFNFLDIDTYYERKKEFSEHEIITYHKTNPEEIYERAKDADILVFSNIKLTKEMIDRLPKLKFIAVCCTGGYNNIDCEYARKKGIIISNIPDYSTKPVAQHTFAFIFAITKKIREYTNYIYIDKDWTKSDEMSFIKEPLYDLDNIEIGIIGFGKIGQEVAKIAHSFGMKVMSVKRNRPYEANYPFVNFVSQDELIKNSRIITLHCPANSETIGMVNKDFLSKMRKESLLINMARGSLVVEEDLVYALNNNLIGYYATDVLASEPMQKDCPLLKAKNILITPHIGWYSLRNTKKLINISADNILAFLNGKPQNVVN